MRHAFLALVLSLPSLARGAMLPVLTEKPPNPEAYKRIDLEGFNFTASTHIGMWHNVGEENPDKNATVWQPAPDGSASFWLEQWGGFVAIILDVPSGYYFPNQTQFGYLVPASSRTWAPLYAGDSLSMKVVSHQWEYEQPWAGVLHMTATASAGSFSKAAVYRSSFITTGSVPEPGALGMVLMGVLAMWKMRRA